MRGTIFINVYNQSEHYSMHEIINIMNKIRNINKYVIFSKTEVLNKGGLG